MKIWIVRNNDNSLSLHLEKPIKDKETGLWVSTRYRDEMLLYKTGTNKMSAYHELYQKFPSKSEPIEIEIDLAETFRLQTEK